ncbi:MAG TPA: CvpA family protein [Solirubrobacterales bacterium]|nr:CvpA family protein [Solirubrobacterales bacterium]
MVTWFDGAVVVVVLVYAFLGYKSGLVRRVIGFAALYAGFYAATYVGHAGVPLLKQANPLLETSDGRIYLFFGTLALVVFLVEVVATLYHQELQVSLVALNHLSGLLVGAFTGLTAVTLAWVVLNAAGNPLGGSLTTAQTRIREDVGHSYLGPKLASSLGGPLETAFRPALPHDLSTYFGGAGSNPSS